MCVHCSTARSSLKMASGWSGSSPTLRGIGLTGRSLVGVKHAEDSLELLPADRLRQTMQGRARIQHRRWIDHQRLDLGNGIRTGLHHGRDRKSGAHSRRVGNLGKQESDRLFYLSPACAIPNRRRRRCHGPSESGFSPAAMMQVRVTGLGICRLTQVAFYCFSTFPRSLEVHSRTPGGAPDGEIPASSSPVGLGRCCAHLRRGGTCRVARRDMVILADPNPCELNVYANPTACLSTARFSCRFGGWNAGAGCFIPSGSGADRGAGGPI